MIRNWAGNLAYGARTVLEPRSVEDLQEVVARSDRLRPSGARHSFSAIGDTVGNLVSLRRLPRVFEMDPGAGTVTVDGGVRYGEICEPLHAAGFALQNLPSLPHVTIAGACATGTHGSGDRSGILATSVLSMELVLADGTLKRAGAGAGADGDVPLAAAAVSLGALGLVTSLTLRLEPTFEMRQDVLERLPIAAFDDGFEAAQAVADSASFFLTWRKPVVDQVWLKRRLGPAAADVELRTGGLAATIPATRDLHPIRTMPADACTPQLGRPGPWHDRLPHFRLSHTPSSGDEVQSEYFVGRADVGRALRALWDIRERLAPVVQISEIRTIAADELWLSPAYERASAAFHFTWVGDAKRVLPVLPLVEAVLEPFQPRAHWAKLSALPAAVIAARHPRLHDVARLAERLDPAGKLRNDMLEALFSAS